VIQQLKAYLLTVDYAEEARRIADMVNSASADLSKEKAELTRIEGQISNGVCRITRILSCAVIL